MEITLEQFQQQIRMEESFRRIKTIKARDHKKEKFMIDRIMDYYLYRYERPGAQPSTDGYKIKVEFTVREFDLLVRIMENKNLDYEKLSKIMGIAKSTVSTNACHLKNLILGYFYYDWQAEFNPGIKMRINELRLYREENKRREFVHNNMVEEARMFMLMPREILVLVRRAGLYGYQKLTLQKIGKILKVTTERIRQIEAKALRKLRHPARRGFSAFYRLIEESGFYKKEKP